MDEQTRAAQALYDAALELELSLAVACDEAGDDVSIQTSRAKAESLLAAIELARKAGMKWGA